MSRVDLFRAGISSSQRRVASTDPGSVDSPASSGRSDLGSSGDPGASFQTGRAGALNADGLLPHACNPLALLQPQQDSTPQPLRAPPFMMVSEEFIDVVVFINARRPAGRENAQSCIDCGVGGKAEPRVDQDITCRLLQSTQIKWHHEATAAYLNNLPTQVFSAARLMQRPAHAQQWAMHCSFALRTCAIEAVCAMDGDAFAWLPTDERKPYPEHLVDSLRAWH